MPQIPFFRRKKHQPNASALTIHSAEQLSTISLHNTPSASPYPPTGDYLRFSDSRLRTDGQPLHHQQQRPSHSHSQSQSSHYYQQQSLPDSQSIRRAQTHHLSLQDIPEPRVDGDQDDRRKLQKNQTKKTRQTPSSLSSPPSSTAKDIPGFLSRSLSKSHRSRPAPGGTRRPAPKDDVLTVHSIPEISTPEPDSQPLPLHVREGESVLPRTSTSTNRSISTKTDSDKLQVHPSKHGSNQQTQTESQYQSYRLPSQLSLATSLVSAHSDAVSVQAMAADRAGGPPGQSSNQTGRQSPYMTDSKNNSQTSQDQGRSTPGPGQSRREEDVDVRALLQKHDELLAKYSKVKRYYFEKDAQVQHLQNTVAHQRMAVSRTVLDDNEYANRFGRLDGAIKDLAFSIRKDWKSLPTWLIGYVNDDAHTVGMKEMTAIGRAFISRWLVEEIFQRHFHPALEPTFSQQLKSIENNLRQQHGCKPINTEEDKENAIAKISNWRRTTFDGLGDAQLHGHTADENRAKLVEHLVSKLVASLEMHLNQPPPVGMDNGARLIVENAVGIAEKIPLESRDVCIEYPMPGSILDDRRMKPETGVPPLTNVKPENIRRPDLEPTDPAGQGQAAADADADADKDPSSPTSQSPSPTTSPAPGSGAGEKKKTSMLGSLMGKRNPPTASSAPSKEGKDDGPGAGGGVTRIRFASFVSAEVRGKGPVNVLAKAPVYVIE